MDSQREYTPYPTFQQFDDRRYLPDNIHEASKPRFTEPLITPLANRPSEPPNLRSSANNDRSSPLKQSLLIWLLAAVTVAIYALTVCYALGTTSLRYLSFTTLSPSRSLALIRILSELTSICLVLLINMCAERVMWMFVATRDGIPLPTFLAVHYGSGIWSWLQLILRNVKGGRLASWCRVVLSIAVPTMAIIILSAIKIDTFFDGQTDFPVAAGIGNFNASFASEYDSIIATYMAKDFSSLLQWKDISWPVTVANPTNSSCAIGQPVFESDCGTGYFLHGGLQLVTPWPTKNMAIPSAPIYTIHGMRGVQLDFTSTQTGGQFSESDCIVLGDESAAIQICISQHSTNAVSAKYVHCPENRYGSCISNKSWQAAKGWTTLMTVYARHATVHFSRANLTAVAVTGFSQPTSYSLSAADMLSVFKLALNSTTGLGRQLDSAQQFIWFMSIYLSAAESSSPTASQAQMGLYNLMAAPIYYFQPTFMSPYAQNPSPNSMIPNLPQNQGLYTTASLSTYYYGLTVAPWSIMIYSVVIAVILCLCIAVLVPSSLPKTAGRVPDTTAWPFIDVAAECRLVDISRDTNRDSTPDRYLGHESTYAHAWRVKGAKGFKEEARVMADVKVKLM